MLGIAGALLPLGLQKGRHHGFRLGCREPLRGLDGAGHHDCGVCVGRVDPDLQQAKQAKRPRRAVGKAQHGLAGQRGITRPAWDRLSLGLIGSWPAGWGREGWAVGAAAWHGRGPREISYIYIFLFFFISILSYEQSQAGLGVAGLAA